jgi:hypothetical protein
VRIKQHVSDRKRAVRLRVAPHARVLHHLTSVDGVIRMKRRSCHSARYQILQASARLHRPCGRLT